MATPLQGTEDQQKSDRWLLFAGLMLILAGLLDIHNGLWAILADEGTALDAVLFENNLGAWGWFFLALGVALVAAGFAVFRRARWAIVFGIGAALLAATVNFFWVFTYPIAAAIIVSLNMLVVYALTLYGLQEQKGLPRS